MSVPVFDTTARAGNTFTLDMALKSDGVPVTDLEGATAEMQWREKLLDVDYVVSAMGVIDAVEATIKFTVTDEETALLLDDDESRARFVYGCKVFYADGSAFTRLTGRILMDKGVVR